MLFTIGTSNRSLCDFLFELRRRDITSIVDVRSSPYSRLGHFSRPAIERWAPAQGLLYRFEGGSLGGTSKLSLDSEAFLEALRRVHEASVRENVAIFCAEGDPAKCHRSYRVGRALAALFGSRPLNILRDGSDERVTETLQRTNPGLLDDVDLLELRIQRPLPF